MVRVRKRVGVHRVWLAAGICVLGALAGYLVGREAIRHATDDRLAEYADRVLQHANELSADVARALNAANSSAASANTCSPTDIGQLRRITFAARFVKDVGRIENSTLLCSGTLGKLAQPLPLPRPDSISPDGSAIYANYPLQIPAGTHAEVFLQGHADAVVSPDVFSGFGQSPIHYVTGIVDPEHTYLFSAHTTSFAIPRAVQHTRLPAVAADSIFLARFSSTYPVGVVTSIRVAEMWELNHQLLVGYSATGALAGLLCGTGLSLARRRRSSHPNQLRRAILTGNLSVVYQPIVELDTHRIVGAEALARWIDEDGDSVRPEIIIGLAEVEGFVSDITRFVVTRALTELRAYLEENPDFRLHINLAPSDLADPRLLILLDESLGPTLVQPSQIAFELIERSTSDREVAIAAIRRLRGRGHDIFIDDFGTGYSNLSYLSELDVYGIKINRSFIATIGTDSVTASIVPQILAVAKALNLVVVVQGIEREQQVAYFSGSHTRMLGQGWFLGMPVPARSLIYLCSEKSE